MNDEDFYRQFNENMEFVSSSWLQVEIYTWFGWFYTDLNKEYLGIIKGNFNEQ